MKEKDFTHKLLINIITGVVSTIITFTLFAILQHEISTTENTFLISLFNFVGTMIVADYIITIILLSLEIQKKDNADPQFYENRHWTTAEINAGAVKRLEIKRKQHKINLLKYLILKYWIFKIYIPKDKSQWGK